MFDIYLREPNINDLDNFVVTMQKSVEIHSPWITAPKSSLEYLQYLKKYTNNDKNKSYLICEQTSNQILGVVNINEIIRGCFQNAFLAYYATLDGINKGIMFQALQLVIKIAFDELKLHRLEANIQQENTKSIKLITKLNFVYEGLSKNYLFINNQWRDHKRYSLLNTQLDYK